MLGGGFDSDGTDILDRIIFGHGVLNAAVKFSVVSMKHHQKLGFMRSLKKPNLWTTLLREQSQGKYLPAFHTPVYCAFRR